MAILLDGAAIAKEIQTEVKRGVEERYQRTHIRPALTVIRVGDYEPSKIYVARKQKACQEVGILSNEIHCPEDILEADLLGVISKCNEDRNVHGILLQLPIPKHLNEMKAISAIAPEKDVDGLTPINMGRLFLGQPLFKPCTPAGIIEILKRSRVQLEGLHAVVIGRSKIVGKPLSILLQLENATVTMCHSKTRNLAEITRSADILVAAIGSPKFVKREHVNPKAIVIDVGINRIEEGGKPKLVGDVDFEAVKDHVAMITPVPGGVGPMTIAMLLKNTLQATIIRHPGGIRDPGILG